MSDMFFKASDFNQCLSSWAGKALSDVDVGRIFEDSGCPDKSDPDPSVGPWCQGEDEQCFAPSATPSDFPSSSFLPTDLPSNAPTVVIPTTSPTTNPTTNPTTSPTKQTDEPTATRPTTSPTKKQKKNQKRVKNRFKRESKMCAKTDNDHQRKIKKKK